MGGIRHPPVRLRPPRWAPLAPAGTAPALLRRKGEGGTEKQQLLFGETGQSLVWDAPEGRASAVNSVQVWRALTGDLGTAETATTGSASIDSANTTVDANSGASSATRP